MSTVFVLIAITLIIIAAKRGYFHNFAAALNGGWSV